jgi:Fe-S oxidoreductase
MKGALVIVFTLLAVAWFAVNFRRLVRLVRSGREEVLWDRVPERVQSLVKLAFGHQKIMEEPGAGLLHLVFFYGLVILGVGHMEHLVSGMTTGILARPLTLEVLPRPFFELFLLSQDVVAFAALAASIIALARRWLHLVPRLDPRTFDGEAILWFIVVLYVTFFGYTATHLLMEPTTAGWFRPFAGVVALPLASLTGTPLLVAHEFFYWGHLVVFLGFLNYLPYSKHAHVMAAAPNVFFKRFTPRGKPTTIDFEKAETYGNSKITEFSWKEMLDAYACTECGRCNAVCPAHLTGKPLQPRKVVHDVKDNLVLNRDAILALKAAPPAEGAAPVELPHPLISKAPVARNGATEGVKVLPNGGYDLHGAFHVDEAWSCTTCGACMEVCPVLIQTVPTNLLEVRRHLVMTESDFPTEMQGALKNLETQGNPWGLPQSEREKWAEGLDVPVMRDKKEADVLFWVGCMGATDDRAKKIQVALVKLLKAAGVDFAILGTEEKCTGDAARRMGQEYLFQNLCQENQATLAQYKFKEIVTACPHCLNTLKHEYADYGGTTLKVRHHTELLADLLASGKLKLKQDGEAPPGRVTFHDPCYLGRYNDVYDAPRRCLEGSGKVDLVEMARTGRKSFCCGAGGGGMFMDEHIGKRVNIERTEQALATGATTVAVGCPFCMTMITDGTKSKGVEEQVTVKDVAEIMAARLT